MNFSVIIPVIRRKYHIWYLKRHGWQVQVNSCTNPCFLNKEGLGLCVYSLASAYKEQRNREKLRKKKSEEKIPTITNNTDILFTKDGANTQYNTEYYGSFTDYNGRP